MPFPRLLGLCLKITTARFRYQLELKFARPLSGLPLFDLATVCNAAADIDYFPGVHWSAQQLFGN